MIDRIPHVIGQGDCHRCNKLVTDLEELRREYLTLETTCRQIAEKAKDDAIKFTIERGRMQDTIDQMRREKNEALCRCQGWDTKGMSSE